MPRQQRPVEITPQMQAVMDEALRAYMIDSSMAEAMCRSAVAIQAKRATWLVRSAVRAEHAAARSRCEAAGTFTCGVTAETPCGVGTACRFSTGELRDLVIPDDAKRTGAFSTRPQAGPDGAHGTYWLEQAVHAVKAQREGSSGTT